MVLNVTNQCNLSCTYCYEYGEDKIVDTENGKQPKFMSEETARESVDFMLRGAGDNKVAHLTFFGGETLLNFPVLQNRPSPTPGSARAEVGKEVDFSLTTNATLLKPEIIEFLAENRVGVTISIDGPKEVQDKFRVFHNGTGSYDIVAPKIKELLRAHRSRPIGARVTLTSDTMDIKRIYRHLTEEIGFWEVGFAPVTTSPNRGYAISDGGFDEHARPVPSTRVRVPRSRGREPPPRVFEREGDARGDPQGRQQGVSVRRRARPDGRRDRRRRRALPPLRRLRRAQARHRARRASTAWCSTAFLEKHHIDDKTDCSRCWARPLCSGGCYHEAHTRYGDTARPNLHYCDWIRGWTDVCLQIYGELAGAQSRRFSRSSMTDEGAGIMKHLKSINRKAGAHRRQRDRRTTSSRCSKGRRSNRRLAPHFPFGCSLVFSPGWEADRTGGTAGLCQPVERDLFDCHIGCYWPAQVPDQLNHAPDWTASAPPPKRTGAKSI